MDINEQIVRAWLEIQGFLVKGRLRYKVTRPVIYLYSSKGEVKHTGWSDIDLIAYRWGDQKRVAVDISAWMTKYISISDVTEGRGTLHASSYERLFKSSSLEARSALRQEFGVHDDDQYEIWLVVSFLAPTQKEQVKAECLKHVDRVIEFREIMNELVDYIKRDPKLPQEAEALQTIRALVLCKIL